jgi:hypothetical protein
LNGCIITRGDDNWALPPKPETKLVTVIPVSEAVVKNNGFYMERQDAQNLADNVAELKAYTEKMEVLVKSMKKYYGAK